jgi:Ca2+/H+ antiporter
VRHAQRAHDRAVLGLLRRVISGCGLMLVGVWLLAGGANGLTGARTVIGILLFAVYVTTGTGVLARATRARVAGLVLSLAGLVVGGSLAMSGVDSGFAQLLFSPADAARWYVVMPTGYVLAIVAAIVGALLLKPFEEAGSGSPVRA